MKRKILIVALGLVGHVGSASAGGWPVFDGVLIQTVREGLAALIGTVEGTAKANINAMGRTADAQAKVINAGTQMAEASRLTVQYQSAPTDCQVAGVADVARQAESDANKRQSELAGNLMARKMNPGLGATERVRAYRDALTKYAETGTMPNADVNVGSLLDGAGPIGKDESMTFTNEQVEAAGRYIMNAISANPPEALTGRALETEEGRKFEMMRREMLSRTSLAQRIHADALAYRTGLQSLGGASYKEFISSQINSRYGNKDYLKSLASAGGDSRALVLEGLYMQGLALRMQELELKHLEKIELALGQILDRKSFSADDRTAIEAQRQRAISAAR